ncbi:MAG TPA: maleylpyruvate isomerase N-terminal domain-containing protein [Pilimelia sp.]|nr:maleylpyruvate isomerase N-terminal domain-containing protein [Pilimelia sp.]
MATRISALLSAAAGPTVPVVRGVRDDQLDLPTPCAEYRVRDLLNHLSQVVVNFRALAARQPVDWGGGRDGAARPDRARVGPGLAPGRLTAWAPSPWP